MFNFEQHTIVFIKDITFGVLYEQICAKDKLNHIVYNTCQQKMGLPLSNIIKSCNRLANSKELMQIEQKQGGQSNLRNELNVMKIHSKSIIMQFKDMNDWQKLQSGKFVRKNIKFNMEECLNEVVDMMKYKANIAQNAIIFNPIYES